MPKSNGITIRRGVTGPSLGALTKCLNGELLVGVHQRNEGTFEGGFLMASEWHVRPLEGNAHVWEVWSDGQLVGRGTEDEAWKIAKTAASSVHGRAVLHYRFRGGIRQLADFGVSSRPKPKRYFA